MLIVVWFSRIGMTTDANLPTLRKETLPENITDYNQTTTQTELRQNQVEHITYEVPFHAAAPLRDQFWQNDTSEPAS